jgi:membrane protein required for colicin V production
MNWLDFLILACIVVGLILGMRDGFVKQLVSLIALILALVFAGEVSASLRNFLLQHIAGDTISPRLLTVICFICAFVAIILLISLLGKIVDLAIKLTPAKPLNILLGGLFGAFIWTLSLSVVFNLFAVFDSGSVILPKRTQEKSKFYHPVKDVFPTVYRDWGKLV